MPIRFPCTACGQLLGIATRKVGTEIHCPTCGLAVIVPDEEQAKLLRQRARGEGKPPFPTPDTPPEISIPRERHEAFDGGLESFLTQLDVTSSVAKPVTATVSANVMPPPKPAPPKAPVPATSVKPTTAAPPRNGSNGKHLSPAQPAVPPVPPATKTPAPPTATPKKQSPPVAPAEEIPLALAFEEHEVSVLSTADMLELADVSPSKLAALPSVTVSAPPKPIPPAIKPAAVPAKPPAVPEAKKAAAPPPPPLAATTNATVTEIAPLVERPSPPAADFGFDFSSPASTTVTARKSEPAPSATVAASPATTAIPTAPFDNAVWVSRRAIYTHVAILVLVSVVTFLIGWISGGAGARVPGSNNAGPVRFEAQIQYVSNGKTLPDEGAVVLLWPKQAKPLERISIQRLAPSEPAPPPDFPALKSLETLRGAYVRTNAQGEVRDLLLSEPGEYYILVISRNLARPPLEKIKDEAIPILGNLFGGEAVTLLGTRQFTLKSYMITDTRTLNHTFGAPAEK